MKINNLYIYLNESWNENQSGVHHLKLEIITRALIPVGELRIRILFPKMIILPPLKF